MTDDQKPAADLFEAPLDAKAMEEYYWDILDASREKFRKSRKRWSRNYAAYGCDFLSEDERKYLRETDRPPVELNLLTSKINAIRGSISNGRMEAQFKPHTDGADANVKAGWMTLLHRKAMVNCNGAEQQDDVLHDGLCTGYGAAEVYLDTSRIPYRGVLREVPLQELDPDPEAHEMALGDRTFDLRHREWLVEQAYATWPHKREEIEAHVQQYGSFSPEYKGTKMRRMKSQPKDGIRGRVEVAQLTYQRFVPRVRWYDPELSERRDTRPEELEARRKELDRVKDANGAPMFETIVEERYMGETWYRATFLVGMGSKQGERGITILDHAESPRVGSTILWLTQLPKKDPANKRVEFFSLLDVAYGLQMVLNRAIQEELAIMARESKGGFRFSKDAVPEGYPGGEAQWIKDSSRPGASLEVQPEGWGFFEWKPLPRIPSGLDRLEEKLVNWIGQAMAITEAFVGSVEREQSAVSLSNLQQQGMVTLGPIVGPYIRFLKDCGVALVEILIRHLPAKDIDRILGYPEAEGLTHERDEESGELVPIMMDDPDDPGTLQPVLDEMGLPAVDPETGEPQTETVYEQIPVTAGYILKQENPLDYDVNIDTGQLTISLRYAIWEIFQQGVLQTMQNALPPSAFQKLAMFLVRNLPVPGEGAVTLEKDIEAALEQEAQLQTEQGIVEFVGGMAPEQAQALVQQLAGATGMQLAAQGNTVYDQDRGVIVNEATGKVQQIEGLPPEQ